MAFTSFAGWARQDAGAIAARLIDETETQSTCISQPAETVTLRQYLPSNPFRYQFAHASARWHGMCVVSSFCCAAPLQQCGTSDRSTTWVSGFWHSLSRGRNTHVEWALFDTPGLLVYCGAPEATVHGNTWRQGRRWSDREEHRIWYRT